MEALHFLRASPSNHGWVGIAGPIFVGTVAPTNTELSAVDYFSFLRSRAPTIIALAVIITDNVRKEILSARGAIAFARQHIGDHWHIFSRNPKIGEPWMSGRLLNDRRVLIVEDEFLVTVVLEVAVQEAGASMVRLAASTADALALIDAESFDVALLDARLDEESVVDVADALEKRGIPFVFHSGYGPEHLPNNHRHRPLLRKPSLSSSVVHALYEAMK